MNYKFGAIIQARQSSSRFPNKVIKNILRKPLIVRLIEQISYSKRLDKIIVATSTEKSDDTLYNVCKTNNIECYRGELDNVLKRYIDAADYYNIDTVIRITGDNPLIDPELIDNMISLFESKNELDYINNVHKYGSVHGSGCELIKFTCLKSSYQIIKDQKDKDEYLEHVTLFIRKNPDKFNIHMFVPPENLCRPEISYSVDYPEDLQVIKYIYNKLYTEYNYIKTSDVLKLLDSTPEVKMLNKNLHKSLPEY
ncbi:MAG TPA: glycosyltransferase family protein [Bacteroidales bacterium]|nr:glycosyltransferase family protein [Bacteroidales bacterium]